MYKEGFPGGSDGKASACNAGNPGSSPGLGRSPEEGNGNPCIQNLPANAGEVGSISELERSPGEENGNPL